MTGSGTGGGAAVAGSAPEGAGRAGGAVRRAVTGTDWEPVVGYSRAVAAGDYIFVSGCTSVAGAEFVHPGDGYAQAAQAIGNVAAGLAALGASLADVVRTRMYVTDISRWQEYGRAHAEAFGDVLPASTMIQVSGLIDARMLIEVEAVAWKPAIGARPGLAAGDTAAAL